MQATLVDEEPGRFFVPAYVGHRGWVGVRLDVDVDWDEVGGIIEDGWREVATKRLITELDGKKLCVIVGFSASSDSSLLSYLDETMAG